jgi:hypothetical protein
MAPWHSIEGCRMDAIHLGPPPHPTVIRDDWEPGPLTKAGRVVRHLPTGRRFAVQWYGAGAFDLTARLIDAGPVGPDDPDVTEIARQAIGYFMLVGQGLPARF